MDLRGRVERIAGRCNARVVPSLAAARGMAVVAVLALVVTGAWVLSARPRSVPVGAPSTLSAAPTGAAAATVVVDVSGRVRHPGIYRLPAADRVDDAVRAAGGALPGTALDTVNLAARLVDGQQLVVGAPAGPPAVPTSSAGVAPSAAGAAPPSARDGPVNLNTATQPQLEQLPKVGPVLAQRILAWRTAHVRFATVAQLRDVPGIGVATFATLRALVTV